jgi:hypothetical protein
MPALVLLGFGMALIVGPMTTAATGVVESGNLGGASGANNTARLMGVLLGIALFGTVVSSAFDSSFESNLVAAGVDPNVAATLAGDTTSDAVAGGAGFEPLRNRMPPGTAPEVLDGVVRAAQESFVDALHSGMLLSIGFMLLATLISLIFVRSHAINLFRVKAPVAERNEPDSMEEEPEEPEVADPTPTPQAEVPVEPIPAAAEPEPEREPEAEPAVAQDAAAEPAERAGPPSADLSTILFHFPFKAGSGSVADNITEFTRAVLDYHDRPGGSPAPQVPLPEPVGSAGATASADIATLTGYLLLEQRFGRINPDIRPELAATALIGAARSMNLWTFSDTNTEPGDDFLEGMIGVVMEGIGPAPHPGPAPVDDVKAAQPPLSA